MDCVLCYGKLDHGICINPNCLMKGSAQHDPSSNSKDKCNECNGLGEKVYSLGPASGLHQHMMNTEKCRSCDGTGKLSNNIEPQEDSVTEIPCWSCGEMNDVGAKSCWSFHCGVKEPNRKNASNRLYLNRRESEMNNIDQLIRLADLFDSRGEHEAAGKIDQMIVKAAPVKTTTSLDSVFEKLAKVADDLDLEGASKEAAMIDGFIAKHAEGRCQKCNGTGYAGPLGDSCDGCEGSGVKTNDDDVEEAFRDEDYHEGDYEETDEERDELHNLMKKYEDEKYGELGPAAKDEVDSILDELELLEGKRAALIKTLSKSADYNEFRQPEGDTDQSKRYDDRHHHNLQVREPKRDQERVDREGRKEHHIDTYKPHSGSLSSRNCPEHIGDMLGRVGPGIFQCPRDGAIYNWELGYTNFDGVKVPGGSISNQTPDSSGYGASHRIFNNRGKV